MRGLIYRLLVVPMAMRMYPGFNWSVPAVRKMDRERLSRIKSLSEDEALKDEIRRVANNLGKALVRRAASTEEVLTYRGGLAALEQLESNLKAIAKQKRK